MEQGPAPEQGPADPDPQREEVVGPSPQQVTDEICRDLLAIHRDSYGRSAETAQAHWLGDTVVVILDGLELLPNEEFLLEHGHEQAIVNVRSQFQKAIEATFRAAVERATGRRVIGFASHTALEEPMFAVEIFRLEPE